MKVLLINPPLINMIMHNFPPPLEKMGVSYPPLGLLYVASYALKYTEHEISFLDTQVEKIGYEELERRINKLQPEVAGIYAPTFLLVDVLNTARVVKKLNKEIHVCLGGPHPILFPRETLDLPDVDSIIIGEGEMAFAELINNLSNGKRDLKKIKGIGFKDGSGKLFFTEPMKELDDLDVLPFPARELAPYNKYYDWMGNRSVATTMITSRGCPYRCIFCWRAGGSYFRARSPQNIISEIEKCIEMGIKEFFIFDDLFTFDRKRVLNICDEIINRRLKINWSFRARINTVDLEMLKKLKKAGCNRIQYGVEAGTDEILKVLRKGITIKQVENIFKMTKEVGITTYADFMIGSPKETDYHINRTIEFAEKLNPDFPEFTITTPYPETELYEMGIREGIIDAERWKRFAEKPTKDFVPQFWEENFSREELIKWLNTAYKKFYIRPSYLLKRLLEVKTLEEFFRKAGIGLRIFKL